MWCSFCHSLNPIMIQNMSLKKTQTKTPPSKQTNTHTQKQQLKTQTKQNRNQNNYRKQEWKEEHWWWWLADFSPWITGVIAWTVPNTIRTLRAECKLNIHSLTPECLFKKLPLTQNPFKMKATLWVLVVSFIDPLGSVISCQSVSD